ncbi:hypothetical protein ABZT34_01220 [Streptomyces sp. NPDC005329]|uniref:hypothetical protein n=1 Tax=Streptomyces sp. NPDC005329 TaxID=3157034 RepID=UPI0033A4A5EE
MQGLFSIGGAIVGAIIGALVTYWIQRARTRVLIDGVSLSVNHPSTTAPAKVNSSLKRRLDSYEGHVGKSQELEVTKGVNESEYVSTFKDTEHWLANDIDISIPTLQEIGGKFQTLLLSKRYLDAFSVFASECIPLFWFLAVSCIRGELGRDFLNTSYDGKARKHKIVTTHKELLQIPLPGPHDISVPKFGPNAYQANIRELARRVSKAFAYEDDQALLEIANHILAGAEHQRDIGQELLSLVRTELNPYRRIVVEGVISNKGRTALSLSNRSKMVLLMKGYTYSRNGKSEKILDDIDIDLELGGSVGVHKPAEPSNHAIETHEYDIDFSSPLVVTAGQSRRFVCRSTSLLQALSNWAELEQAFQGSDRKCYIALGLLTARGDVKAVYSRDLLFRDLVQAQELPRRHRSHAA